jgi:hypothetical protein
MELQLQFHLDPVCLQTEQQQDQDGTAIAVPS